MHKYITLSLYIYCAIFIKLSLYAFFLLYYIVAL
uniref:Serine-rich and transmembrane domain-containing protein 1 n=1 Tax=Siphoviridae sp. ct7EW56 TaxID=2827562 RepID=A0A8S5LS07_9CAUD|nr:MAG TPA: Serine-rich and transmembrane domain-containing protein 1 [Siphoviridae sp. ct7EW56]